MMLGIRVLPCLLLRGAGLVKTVRFKAPRYIGDPRNAVKIFSEKEVDELILLDILATPEDSSPPYDFIEEIVSEAFMPVAYGGGVRTVQQAKDVLSVGVEKIVVCSQAVADPEFVRELADALGSQSVVVCMDVKRNWRGTYQVLSHGGSRAAAVAPEDHATRVAELGAGELVVQSIDRDGTMSGYDLPLVRSVASLVDVPVVALGGAGSLQDLRGAVVDGGASAVAAASMFVYRGPRRAVLISYPTQAELRRTFSDSSAARELRGDR